MKIYKTGVEWGGPDDDWYYFYWWNWLPKESRYVGFSRLYYDGWHNSFGLWFTNITWSTWLW